MATTKNVRTRTDQYGLKTPVVTDLIVKTLQASKKAAKNGPGLTAGQIVERVQNRALKFGVLPSRRTITSRLSSLYYTQDAQGSYIVDSVDVTEDGKRLYVLNGTPKTQETSSTEQI